MSSTLFPRRLAACVLAAAFGLGLSACGNLLPGVSGPAPSLYTLTPKSTFPSGLPTAEWQLVVEPPTAPRGTDTDQIALQPSSTELKYFAGVRWIDRAPKMIQSLLVESFENTDRIVGVGRQAIGLDSDFNLISDLREFQADYSAGENAPPRIVVRINVKLVKQPELTIVASRTFESVVQATGTDMPTIIRSFDDALGPVLRDIVVWTLRTVPPEGRGAAR
ncbi:ABC-type transport auxiliary lipoprotein family protein [Zavarzinia sp. CC-PAN008]|uniref:ABC-type transport auxiliary lipoprotein family protein n=1 Tax=Zavarzinia sp. CC-PAN008 TaxID=3243332 RepID=UPI003F745042